MFTQEQIKNLFDYHPDGYLVNRHDRGRSQKGDRVGWVNDIGYIKTKIRGVHIAVHRLIWLYHHGYLPEWPHEIDHRDGKRNNNKLENLRLATRTQNLGNADTVIGLSGTRGVYPNIERSKWRASIRHRGRSVFLGDYDNIPEAEQAYLGAKEVLYGEFAFHKRPLNRRI